MEDGWSVQHQNKLGLTPVHIAAAHGHAVALKVVLLRFTRCRGSLRGELIHLSHIADLLQMMLVNQPEAVNVLSAAQETPLFWATHAENVCCIRILLFWGAKTDVVNARGQKAMDISSSDAVRQLLKGSDPGKHPGLPGILHSSCSAGSVALNTPQP